MLDASAAAAGCHLLPMWICGRTSVVQLHPLPSCMDLMVCSISRFTVNSWMIHFQFLIWSQFSIQTGLTNKILEQTARQDLCSPYSFQLFDADGLLFSRAALLWICLLTIGSSSSPPKLIFASSKLVWSRGPGHSWGLKQQLLCSCGPPTGLASGPQCSVHNANYHPLSLCPWPSHLCLW